MSINILIPANNIKERKYVVDIIFNQFLNIEYTLKIGANNYEIILQNGKKLIFKDGFFNKFPRNMEYLKYNNLPTNIKFSDNRFASGIPIIFGNLNLMVKDTSILCGIDIFASIFFMLTRWEEYVNSKRDTHNRFPATESTAYKNNFIDRPVVNEYINMLKKMMQFLEPGLHFRNKRSKIYLTHDVDVICLWKNWGGVYRVVVGDILKRRSLSLAFERVAEYYLINKNKIKDPFDTFDWLMDKSETIGLKSRFYFMSGGLTKFDNNYKIDESKSLNIIDNIKQRGHIIGFHPSYDTYNDGELFSKEKCFLEKTVRRKITEGRQHYLCFEVPTTWQIWEDNDMSVDSTCGYADREGFRCGTGNEFQVFNVLTRKALRLLERPLIFMDGRDFHCGGYVSNTLFDHNLFDYLENIIVNNITILFHNNIFIKQRFVKEYEKILYVWNKQNNKQM